MQDAEFIAAATALSRNICHFPPSENSSPSFMRAYLKFKLIFLFLWLGGVVASSVHSVQLRVTWEDGTATEEFPRADGCSVAKAVRHSLNYQGMQAGPGNCACTAAKQVQLSKPKASDLEEQLLRGLHFSSHFQVPALRCCPGFPHLHHEVNPAFLELLLVMVFRTAIESKLARGVRAPNQRSLTCPHYTLYQSGS